MKKIIPAILASKLSEVREKIELVKDFADWVQVDICDNKFVPNKTIEIKHLKGLSEKINLEIHLMVNNPSEFFEDCAEIGTKRVIAHVEAVDDIEYVLHRASQFDFEFGLAINPKTPISLIEPFLSKINLILLLSVDPGFAGQKFKSEVLQKIKHIKNINDGITIAMDGGIDHDSIKLASEAGVNIFVVGSALFGVSDVKENYLRLIERLR